MRARGQKTGEGAASAVCNFRHLGNPTQAAEIRSICCSHKRRGEKCGLGHDGSVTTHRHADGVWATTVVGFDGSHRYQVTVEAKLEGEERDEFVRAAIAMIEGDLSIPRDAPSLQATTGLWIDPPGCARFALSPIECVSQWAIDKPPTGKWRTRRAGRRGRSTGRLRHPRSVRSTVPWHHVISASGANRAPVPLYRSADRQVALARAVARDLVERELHFVENLENFGLCCVTRASYKAQ